MFFFCVQELCKVPRLVVGDVTKDNLTEGKLGQKWFVSACSALAKTTKLFQKVVPDLKSQEWGEKGSEYGGIFKFSFWRFGKWIDIVVDDRLPCINGQLLFSHSTNKNEFWVALLEKAYAK